MIDNVNHPPHYNNSPAHCDCGRRIECIDVTRYMSFNIGNVIKYLWRYKDKDGLEGLKKARWYLEDTIKQLEPTKDIPTFCNYSTCSVQLIEHYHIDEHTLTFRKPEVE